MDTWMIIFYLILAATIVSYTILMNYKKDRNEYMETGDQEESKKVKGHLSYTTAPEKLLLLFSVTIRCNILRYC